MRRLGQGVRINARWRRYLKTTGSPGTVRPEHSGHENPQRSRQPWRAKTAPLYRPTPIGLADGHGRARTHAIRSRYYPASVAVRAGRGVPFPDRFQTNCRAICGNSPARPVCRYRVSACNRTCNGKNRRKLPLLQRYRCYRSLIGSGKLMG